jgi:hypothetical protein
MNRRDFVKFAAAVPFIGIPSLAFAKEAKPEINNRRAKYRQYLGLYADESTGIMKSFSRMNKLNKSTIALDLALYGTYFKPKNHWMRLYPGFVFAVRSTQGRLLEYQYIQNGVMPNIDVVKYPIRDGCFNPVFTRFKPEQMTQISLDSPDYGISLLEEARIARYERGEIGNLMKYVKMDGFIKTATFNC